MSRYTARVSRERRLLVLCGGILIAAVLGMWIFLSVITASEPECRAGGACTGIADSPNTPAPGARLGGSPAIKQRR
jgi:hypothetical protein